MAIKQRKAEESMDALILEIKQKLINNLNLKHLTPEAIEDDGLLFGAGLGLDSIDALEIIVMLDNDYGIKFANQDEAREVFTSVRTIAEYIAQHESKV